MLLVFTSPCANRDAYSGMDTPGSKRKLYSAVPGRHYVVVKSYQPQTEGEITLYKNDRVKGKCFFNKPGLGVTVYFYSKIWHSIKIKGNTQTRHCISVQP